MKTKQIIVLVLAVILAFGFTACGQAHEASKPTEQTPSAEVYAGKIDTASSESAGSRIFVDDCGREVVIPENISRIAVSGPLPQIVLFAIAPEMLVGLASRLDDEAKSILPEQYFSLPFLGQLYGSADLNVEELAKADPQVIIDIGEAKKSAAEDMNLLQEQTMIPSVHIEASLGTMADAFLKLGGLLGKEEKAEELAQFCRRVYSRTQSIMESVGEENKVKALFITGEDGLNVLAKDSYHAELVDLLTDNLAVVENPSAKGLGNAVTMEQLMLWNPDFIIFAPGSIYSTVRDMDTWSYMKAVEDGKYVETPSVPHNWMGQPPAVQRYLGMIWLTSVLYPDVCDYDVKAEIMEYYKLFYGCILSDAQYEALTANAFLK